MSIALGMVFGSHSDESKDREILTTKTDGHSAETLFTAHGDTPAMSQSQAQLAPQSRQLR